MKNAAIRFIAIFAVFAVFDSALTAVVRVGEARGLPLEFVFWNNLYGYRFFWTSFDALLFAAFTVSINRGIVKEVVILDLIFAAVCGLYYAFMFHPYRFSRELSREVVRPAFEHVLILETADFASHVIEAIAPFVVLALVTGSYKKWRWPKYRIRSSPAVSAGIEDWSEDVR